MLLDVRTVTKNFGGLKALSCLDLTAGSDEVVGLIGPNGAGKSTLFNVATGVYPPDEGEVVFRDRRINGFSSHEIVKMGIARTFQNIRLFAEMTALENVMVGRHCRTKAALVHALLRTKSFTREEKEIEESAKVMLDFVGLLKSGNEVVKNLPYGYQRRVEIARALATDPALLLLDEPTAGMNPKECNELVGLVQKIRDEGDCSHNHRTPHERSDDTLGSGNRVGLWSQDRRRETRGSATRCEGYRGVSGIVRSRFEKCMLLEVSDIQVLYGQIAALKGVSLELNEGEILAIIGANGAGKTTLINTISGILHPRTGSIKFRGELISSLPAWRIARKGILQIPEGRRVFAKQSVLENLELGAYPIKDKSEVRKRVEKMYSFFPVLSERRTQLAGTLSGGEQQMLAIGRGLMANPQLLLFDEPSMGLSPVLVEKVFKIIQEISKQGITILLVEQNAKKSLQIATRAYVLETGKIVLSDRADRLLENEQVKQAYLGG